MLVVATGEIDLSSAPTLLAKLDNALRHPSCRTLITDLRGVQFLGARGITVLLTIQHTADTHDVRLASWPTTRPCCARYRSPPPPTGSRCSRRSPQPELSPEHRRPDAVPGAVPGRVAMIIR
jgi:hypothetical protein